MIFVGAICIRDMYACRNICLSPAIIINCLIAVDDDVYPKPSFLADGYDSRSSSDRGSRRKEAAANIFLECHANQSRGPRFIFQY